MAVGLDLADFIVMLSQLSISVGGVSSSLNCIDPVFIVLKFLICSPNFIYCFNLDTSIHAPYLAAHQVPPKLSHELAGPMKIITCHFSYQLNNLIYL